MFQAKKRMGYIQPHTTLCRSALVRAKKMSLQARALSCSFAEGIKCRLTLEYIAEESFRRLSIGFPQPG